MQCLPHCCRPSGADEGHRLLVLVARGEHGPRLPGRSFKCRRSARSLPTDMSIFLQPILGKAGVGGLHIVDAVHTMLSHAFSTLQGGKTGVENYAAP